MKKISSERWSKCQKFFMTRECWSQGLDPSCPMSLLSAHLPLPSGPVCHQVSPPTIEPHNPESQAPCWDLPSPATLYLLSIPVHFIFSPLLPSPMASMLIQAIRIYLDSCSPCPAGHPVSTIYSIQTISYILTRVNFKKCKWGHITLLLKSLQQPPILLLVAAIIPSVVFVFSMRSLPISPASSETNLLSSLLQPFDLLSFPLTCCLPRYRLRIYSTSTRDICQFPSPSFTQLTVPIFESQLKSGLFEGPFPDPSR